MCPHKVDVNLKFDVNAMQNIAQHRRVAIEQCIEALTHSCLCHDAYCRRTACMKMKRVVIHTSICKRKIQGNCPICKQLIALCCYHAKNCREARCVVPFCNTVKAKMRQQNLLFDRLDAARGLLRAQQLDPDESDAIDVNMAGAPPFGEDVPSGSGEFSARVRARAYHGLAGPSGVRHVVNRSVRPRANVVNAGASGSKIDNKPGNRLSGEQSSDSSDSNASLEDERPQNTE